MENSVNNYSLRESTTQESDHICYLIVDPGRDKFGFLVVKKGHIVKRGIENSDCFINQVESLRGEFASEAEAQDEFTVVVGDGTCSGEFTKKLKQLGYQPTLIDEKNSTIDARKLYFRDNPPKFPWSWLPDGLLSVSVPIDDYAAEVIWLRYIETKLKKKPTQSKFTLP